MAKCLVICFAVAEVCFAGLLLSVSVAPAAQGYDGHETAWYVLVLFSLREAAVLRCAAFGGASCN
ncbi:MAG: hypothetical protein ACPGWR_07900 [Ardenticatenaceae bacterium]